MLRHLPFCGSTNSTIVGHTIRRCKQPICGDDDMNGNGSAMVDAAPTGALGGWGNESAPAGGSSWGTPVAGVSSW